VTVRSARSIPLIVLALLFLLLGMPSNRIAASQLESSPTYTNDVAGFRQYVQNLLAIATSGDQEKLAALVKDAEIPDYRAYYGVLYGQEGGEKVSNVYVSDLQARGMEFEEYLT
jgi:hypothetical protein